MQELLDETAESKTWSDAVIDEIETHCKFIFNPDIRRDRKTIIRLLNQLEILCILIIKVKPQRHRIEIISDIDEILNSLRIWARKNDTLNSDVHDATLEPDLNTIGTELSNVVNALAE